MTFDEGQSGQAVIRDFVRQARAHVARGGRVDKILQRISNLPDQLAAAAQEILLGNADASADCIDPANPQQRFPNRKEKLAAIFRRKLGRD
jgi:hypothetical protein